MYDMEEGGASVGKGKAGTVRYRLAHARVFSLESSGRALIARHRGGTTLRKEESERCSSARRLQARADPRWPERDRRRHYLLERHTGGRSSCLACDAG